MNKCTGIIIFMLLACLCMPAGRAMGQNYSDSTFAVDTTFEDEDIVAPPEETGNQELYKDEETTASGEAIAPVIIQMPADSVSRLKADKSFAYMAYLDSLLKAEQHAKKYIQPEPRRVPDNSPSFWSLAIVKFLFWGIAITVVIFVLFQLFNGQGGMLTTNKKLDLPIINTDADIPENDLEGLLQKAIRNGNYRLAVRYQFLKTLNRLGERGILKLSTDKTNYQYAAEIYGKPYANSFAKLCLQYEYVWFGEFELNQGQFSMILNDHQQFLKEI